LPNPEPDDEPKPKMDICVDNISVSFQLILLVRVTDGRRAGGFPKHHPVEVFKFEYFIEMVHFIYLFSYVARSKIRFSPLVRDFSSRFARGSHWSSFHSDQLAYIFNNSIRGVESKMNIGRQRNGKCSVKVRQQYLLRKQQDWKN
jgi:hypothetical protein